jgi:hypothetical protein
VVCEGRCREGRAPVLLPSTGPSRRDWKGRVLKVKQQNYREGERGWKGVARSSGPIHGGAALDISFTGKSRPIMFTSTMAAGPLRKSPPVLRGEGARRWQFCRGR